MQPLVDIMIQALNFFYGISGGNYGYAIIFLTIAINMALYPLTLSSIVQMSALQRVQPKVKDLQTRLKDDPQKMQKEIMEIYKKEKVNPMGGCLPMLVKIPFFIALFFALQSQEFINEISNPAKNASFLWITGRISEKQVANKEILARLEKAGILLPDKSKVQKMFVWSPKSNKNEKGLEDELAAAGIKEKTDIDIIKKAWQGTSSLARPDPYLIFIILIALTTYFSQKTMPGSASQQAGGMLYFMPIFIAAISISFPSGVQLYWVISNLVAIGQQVFIARNVSRETF
ncbi:membrane protein insertase YidC [Candidatus Saganbacteria bacterium]|nr:membrane protein insertase YidC [Candidatus Saganbacteria bacterium]